MRKQLRPFYTPEEYANVYSTQFNHANWSAHIERVNKTIRVLDKFAYNTHSQSVADLSCGDGAILEGSRHPWQKKWTGDYTTTGPIETTIQLLPHVDMFVLSETLEHIEDPDDLLVKIRDRTDHLLLTTPHGEDTDENPQHYWGWDREALALMLDAAGFNVGECELFTPKSNEYYTFQIWTCT